MASTPDPRDFYRVGRVVLTPLPWRESLGRVAVLAMADDSPLLVSNCGTLPETMGDARAVEPTPDTEGVAHLSPRSPQAHPGAKAPRDPSHLPSLSPRP